MNINKKCCNYLRSLACDMITNAKSGHPGVALGATEIMYALFADHYFYDVKDHNFFARDRFVLSCGHASALYYATAYMFNFGLSENDLKNFRQMSSICPGHPELNTTNFVETSTGPLGQGVANAVGMAIAESMVASKFNAQKYPVIDNYTYCLCGDGCLMEGVAQEAISLAGTLKLNKLILLYDCNKVTIDGKLDISNTENPVKKFKSMGFNVIVCRHGNDYYRVTRAIARAKRCQNKPSVVIFKTTIGKFAANEGLNEIHGTPLDSIQLNELKDKLGTSGSFYLPGDVKAHAIKTNERNNELVEKWNNTFAIYEKACPELYKQLIAYLDDKNVNIEHLVKDDNVNKDWALRDANAFVLKELSAKMPRFVGGTADVVSSTRAYIENGGDYSFANRRGKNIHYGVREHAMGAICNGITLYMKCPSFCSTFMGFSNYMLPAVRMSALMNIPSMFMFSHDTYLVGEDGPSHQSVEQLGTLRLMPNLNVFRPCDMTELLACYDVALKDRCPSAFVLTKQTLKKQDNKFEDAKKGGYVLCGDSGEIEILTSGSEVELSMSVKAILESQDIKVVVASFPCLEEFLRQSEKYQNDVLSRGKLKISLERSNDKVWDELLGEGGHRISVENFGKSAKPNDLDKYYKFEPNEIAKIIKKYYKNMNIN